MGSHQGHEFRDYPDKSMDPMHLIAPNMILFPSTVLGPQFASRFTIEHERLPNNVGRWWIKFNGIRIGFYFDSLFDNTGSQTNKFIDKGACEAIWYSEAYNPGRDPKKPNAPAPNWPPTGSGEWAMAGLGKASFWASMAYLDSAKMLKAPVKGATLDQVKGVTTNAGCYTSYGPVSLLPPFDSILFVSGPGSAAPNNTCPPPP